MHAFTLSDRVAKGTGFAIWRKGYLIGVDVEGVVDDAVSDGWRAALADEFQRGGHPRFLAIDFSRCDPQNSMAARYRTVLFAREHMTKIEWAILLTGRSPGPLVVVRAALRTMGLPNLQMTSDGPDFVRAIERMMRGQRPGVDTVVPEAP